MCWIRGAGVDDGQVVVAKQIGVGASKGHRRRITRQHAPQAGSEMFSFAGQRLEIGLRVLHHTCQSISVTRELQSLTDRDIPFSPDVG